MVIVCSKIDGHLQVKVAGTGSDELEQQIRNLIGIWPLARLTTAPRIRRKGQPGSIM